MKPVEGSGRVYFHLRSAVMLPALAILSLAAPPGLSAQERLKVI